MLKQNCNNLTFTIHHNTDSILFKIDDNLVLSIYKDGTNLRLTTERHETFGTTSQEIGILPEQRIPTLEEFERIMQNTQSNNKQHNTIAIEENNEYKGEDEKITCNARHLENTKLNVLDNEEKLLITDDQRKPTKTFGKEDNYHNYTRGTKRTNPEYISFIDEIIKYNPDIFDPELATLDTFREAINKEDAVVVFLRTGRKYTPFYKETVAIMGGTRWDYANINRETRTKLDKRDLMSFKMLVEDLRNRIPEPKLTQPEQKKLGELPSPSLLSNQDISTLTKEEQMYYYWLTSMTDEEIEQLGSAGTEEPTNVDNTDLIYTKRSNSIERSGEYVIFDEGAQQNFSVIKLCGGFEHTNTSHVVSVGSTKIAIHDFTISGAITNQFPADELLEHGILPSHMLAYIDTDQHTSVVTFIAPQTVPFLNDNQKVSPREIASISAGLLNTIDFLNEHGLAMQITSLDQLRKMPNSAKVYMNGVVTAFEPDCDILWLVDEESDNVTAGEARRYEPIWFRPNGDFTNKSHDLGEFITKMRNKKAKLNPGLQVKPLNIPRISSSNNQSNPLLIKSTNTANGIDKPAENYTTKILEARNLSMVISIIWAIAREIDDDDEERMKSFSEMRSDHSHTIDLQKADFDKTFRRLGIDENQLKALRLIMFSIHPYTSDNSDRSDRIFADARAALEKIAGGNNSQNNDDESKN